ncbi:MAG TPA: glutathione S-transferase family protein [Polyangiaceae bacterium]|jgi:glutathione S-transferase|nr:glutathione S-transferase family protein [Polyangiaceae bacterium]
MKLYMNVASPNVRRVRLTAAVLGIQLDEIVVDFAKGEQKTPEYLALNPNGAVPTLVDGDFVLTESRAIMQYLASKKPESGLMPRDEKARADVTRWQFWDAIHFSPHVGTFAFQRVLKAKFGLGAPDQAKIDEALVGFRRYAAVLEARLEKNQHVAGDALTVADLTIASSLTYAAMAEVPIAEFPHLAAWFARIADMPAWKASSPF